MKLPEVREIETLALQYGFKMTPVKKGSPDPDYIFENDNIMFTAKHKFDSYTIKDWDDFFKSQTKTGR